MGKKRKAPARAAAPVREPAPNPFERLANKKRFDILGRKVKGETRNVVRLRTDAAEKASQRYTEHPGQAHVLPLCPAPRLP